LNVSSYSWLKSVALQAITKDPVVVIAKLIFSDYLTVPDKDLS
jgi:hypothetical protein